MVNLALLTAKLNKLQTSAWMSKSRNAVRIGFNPYPPTWHVKLPMILATHEDIVVASIIFMLVTYRGRRIVLLCKFRVFWNIHSTRGFSILIHERTNNKRGLQLLCDRFLDYACFLQSLQFAWQCLVQHSTLSRNS